VNKFKYGQRVTLNGKPGAIDYVYSYGGSYNVRFDATGLLSYATEPQLTSLETAPEPTKETTVNNTVNVAANFQLDAVKAVIKLARTRKQFTTDDVWANVKGPGLVDPRALGSIMISAAGQGAIKATGRYKPSKRPECHKRPIRVWKSLLYVGK
jgi:hypothetical protein